MKREIVSSVYEGRKRNGSREEEETSKKRARMHARARKYSYKANARARSFVTNEKTIVTRSMMKSMGGRKNEEVYKIQEENKINTDVLVSPEIHSEAVSEPTIETGAIAEIEAGTSVEPKFDTGASVEVETPPAKAIGKPGTSSEVGTNAELKNGSEAVAEPIIDARMDKWEGGGVWWEEWPMLLSYEEEWMWSRNNGWENGRPYWEVMDFGCPDIQDDDEEPWEDDIWNLRDIKEVPKP